MSIKLRIIGGVCPPTKPGELMVDPDTDSLATIVAKLAAVLNVPEDRTQIAKVSPIIKGKKGDVLNQTDTFGSRGIGANDILFVVVPPKPGATPTPRPASPVSPKSPVGKVAGKKMLSKSSPSPVGKKALSPPSSAKAPVPAKGPSRVPAKAISGKSSPAAASIKTFKKKVAAPKPAAADDDMDFASAFSGGMMGGGKATGKGSDGGSDSDESPPSKGPGGGGIGGSAFSGGMGRGNKNGSDDDSEDDSDDGSDSSGGGGNTMGGVGLSPSQFGGAALLGIGGEDSDDSTDSEPKKKKPTDKKKIAAPSPFAVPTKALDSKVGGAALSVKPPTSTSQSKPLPMPRSPPSSEDDDSEDPSSDGSKRGGSSRAPSPSPAQVEKIVNETMKAKFDEIGHKYRLDDEGQRQKFEQEISIAVEKELKAARADLVAMWESQREEATKSQRAIEEQRLEHIKSTTEREAQLQESQAKFIDALQVRRNQENQQDEHLNELLLANKELREELRLRRDAADKRIKEMSESYGKSSILNPDNRVDNILLIQSQIARSLKSFNSLPTHQTPGHVSDFDANVSMPVLLTSLGLERYIEPLSSRDVTPSVLLGMSDEDLQDCGVDTLGARRRILAEIQRRKNVTRPKLVGGFGGVGGPAGGGGTFPVAKAHLAEIHSRILRGAFKKHDEGYLSRIQEFLDAFGGRGMDDLYATLAYKYKIKVSSYRSVMLNYLANRHPDLQGAVDIICDVFEGREAEFGELVETLALRRPLPPRHLWVQFHNGDKTSFYFNALCGLSQIKIPKIAAASKEPLASVQPRKFSSRYPTTEGEIKYLGDGYLFPYQQLKANDSSGREEAEDGDDTASATSESGRKKSSSRSSRASKVPVSNPSNFQPNPSHNDDANSYNRLYRAHVYAHLFTHHYDALANFPAQAAEYRGRELEWLLSLRAQSSILAGL